MILDVILIVIGFLLLIKGADILVQGSSNLAKKFHIDEIIIGLTVVSIGTSMPELFLNVKSSVIGYSDLAIGNVIGSNISNLLLILGCCAILREIKVKKETKLIEIPICLFITFLFALFCNSDLKITRNEGILLTILFLLFILYTIYMSKRGKEFNNYKDENKNQESTKTLISVLYIVIGIIALKYGGDLTVNHSINIAKYFGISEKVIGLTILALGTSLPELITGIIAVSKGENELAIGNVIGSNIFNILLIIGVSSIIKPIYYNINYNSDLILLIAITILLAMFILLNPKDKISKKNGILYLSLYFVYIGILFVK